MIRTQYISCHVQCSNLGEGAQGDVATLFYLRLAPVRTLLETGMECFILLK